MDSKNGQGTLYVCATPIGNLSDISERALSALRGADIIAAEDTRNSIKLLNHFDIKVPLTSYHEYNKYDKANELIAKIQAGADVVLITDAGTPAISDPGQVLADMCHTAGITVVPVPGPCAAITALSASGIDSRRFVFEGFLPSDKKERREVLEDLANETRTMIVYEAPHHLKETLRQLSEALGDRNIAICRELTKKFEQIMRMRLLEAKEYYEDHEPKGEYVLILEGKSRDKVKEEKACDFLRMDIHEHMAMYESRGIDRKEAMKMVAADRGVSKRDIYKELLEDNKEEEE